MTTSEIIHRMKEQSGLVDPLHVGQAVRVIGSPLVTARNGKIASIEQGDGRKKYILSDGGIFSAHELKARR